MEPAYKQSDFAQIMKGRRSIRKYDETVKISKEEMKSILEDATTAPSSVNMQPWRFVVVESDEAKAKLQPLVRSNQLQLETSAAMIVIFGDMNSIEMAEKIYGTTVERGWMPAEVKERQIGWITPLYKDMPKQKKTEIILIDGGLVAMQLMLTARAYGYDTNPIGGFDRDHIAAALELDPERYYPVMIVSIGKAAEEGFQTFRLPVEDIATWK